MTDVPSTPEDRQEHWDVRYATLGVTSVSWFEDTPTMSLDALDAAGVAPTASVIDLGGGAARLVDALLARGFGDLTVLDVSEAAFAEARRRVGERDEVTWVRSDLLTWRPTRTWTVWHDRAVFHFLTDAADRRVYRGLIRQAVEPGGVVVVATFALDGPEYCSGLPVRRYDAPGLAAEVGPDLDVIATGGTTHRTPSDTSQPFIWVALRR